MRSPRNRQQIVEQLTDQALLHQRAGRLHEALALYKRALNASPRDVNALHLAGLVHLRLGNPIEAVRLIRKAIKESGPFAPFYNSLGNAQLAADDVERAIAAFRRALALDSRLAGVHVNLGNALKRQGRLDEAAESYRAALAIDRRLGAAHLNLGNILREQDKFDEAVVSYRLAIESLPNSAEAYTNLGMTYHQKRAWQEALSAMEISLQINPDQPEALFGLSQIYCDIGQFDDSIRCLDRALALKPEYAEAMSRRGLTYLVQGCFEQGWRDYVRGRTVKLYHRDPLNGNLVGSHILVHKDQGLGDEIFFLRFTEELKRRGAHITYLAGEKIASIVSRLSHLDEVVTTVEPSSPPNIPVLAGNLPYLLGMKSLAEIPPPLQLAVLPERVTAQSSVLAAIGAPPYIGITWRAGSMEGTLFKLAPLDRIGAALRDVPGTLIALQRLPEAGEIAALAEAAGRPVHDFTALNDELEDMLALLSLLDDYVAVSNTNVHLRAGTGRTSRILVPTPPEWRWMASGDESPWFPGCAVYRQAIDGAWDEALARLKADLMTRWSAHPAAC